MTADDLVAPLLKDLPGPHLAPESAMRDRAAQILRPTGALARFDRVAAWLAGWQGTEKPTAAAPALTVFVGDHGVADRGVSAYPQAITGEMLKALRAGKATASVMARDLGVDLEVIDVGVGRPTGDITFEDALTPERFEECFEIGRKTVASSEADILIFGEMGIGNTTPAAAVCASLYGMRADDWTGRGTGVDDEGLQRKIAAVDAARSRIDGGGPFEILRRVGGSELVAIAGATLEARRRSIPVVLDGFVTTASVGALAAARSDSLDHCIAGHCSPEPGHRLLLEKLALEPLLDLGMRLGEGTGALAALPLIRLAVSCVVDVATFEEWGIEP